MAFSPDKNLLLVSSFYSSKFSRVSWSYRFLCFVVVAVRHLSWNIPEVGASQVALVVRTLPANAGDIRDMGLTPGLERSPRGENGNLLQYSCLENPIDRGAWWATIYGVAELEMTEWLSTHFRLTEKLKGVLFVLGNVGNVPEELVLVASHQVNSSRFPMVSLLRRPLSLPKSLILCAFVGRHLVFLGHWILIQWCFDRYGDNHWKMS